MTDIAVITGISGQDGHYLAAHLLTQGTHVIGTTRDAAATRTAVDPALSPRIELIEWDLFDQDRFLALLHDRQPTHVYNLAAFSSGEFMDRNPELVTDINGVAVLRMLEAIRQTDASIRFCQASSSEVFAASDISPQDEQTPRVPRSVYGAAKIYADNIVRLYRAKYGLFACSAILFNHESPRRGGGFVTTKIVRAAVAIRAGLQDKLTLGNLDAARDWGFAGDYVRAMALMGAAPLADDYIVATGKTHTVAEFCERAFQAVSLDYRDHVEVDPTFFRPTEPHIITGDAARARDRLGWTPTISFDELVDLMVRAELRATGVSA